MTGTREGQSSPSTARTPPTRSSIQARRWVPRTGATGTPPAGSAIERTAAADRLTHSFARLPLRPGVGDSPEPPIQAKSSYDLKDGSSIWTEVEDGTNPMTVTGKLRVDEQNTLDVNGSLKYKASSVPKASVAGTSFLDKFKLTTPMETVLEIKTVDAAPRGRKLGQLLTWHLGRLAASAGHKYVTARNVSDARGPFYTPLGFQDFLDQTSWADLTKRKTDIEAKLQAPDVVPQQADVDEYKAVTEKMSQNAIFISSADLIRNSETKWKRLWRAAG